jgi:hypothetical protein
MFTPPEFRRICEQVIQRALSLPNVQEHAPSPAGASAEPSVEPQTREGVGNKAAGDGCCVSSCSDLPVSFTDVPQYGSAETLETGTHGSLESDKHAWLDDPILPKLWGSALEGCQEVRNILCKQYNLSESNLLELLEAWRSRDFPHPRAFREEIQ